jgi:UDP-glucose 4-epimerase
MVTALVTGGAGFIGSHLVEALLAAGRRVVVLDDFSTGKAGNLAPVHAHPGLSLLEGCITRPEPLLSLVDEADEIYHLAAVVGVRRVLEHPERTVSTNIGPVEAILQRLERHPGKKLFLASTSEVYGKNPKQPLAEDDDIVLGPTTRGRWIYAASKALDEYLALAAHQRWGLAVVIGRFFNVVGPRQVGDFGMVLPRFVDAALAGQPLIVHGTGEQVRCFAHVGDVIPAVLSLMQHPGAPGRAFNLGSDRPVSIRELAESVAASVEPVARIEFVPYERAFGVNFEDIPVRIPDLTRIKQLIGYAPRSGLAEIVRSALAWRRGG